MIECSLPVARRAIHSSGEKGEKMNHAVERLGCDRGTTILRPVIIGETERLKHGIEWKDQI